MVHTCDLKSGRRTTSLGPFWPREMLFLGQLGYPMVPYFTKTKTKREEWRKEERNKSGETERWGGEKKANSTPKRFRILTSNVVYTYNSSPQEDRAGISKVLDHPGYVVRPCLNNFVRNKAYFLGVYMSKKCMWVKCSFYADRHGGTGL